MCDWQKHTCEGGVARNLWQRSVNQLLKVDFLILKIVDGLSRTQTRFSKSKWSSRLVAVERFNIEDAEGSIDILHRKGRAMGGPHKPKRLNNYLTDAVLDILS